jgi:tetratricopeptide (TPR) repeat protein
MAKINFQTLGKALLISVCAVTIPSPTALAADSPAIRILLDRAKTQADSGHLDIAASTWKQVLASDPNNFEALRNLASAEAQLGDQAGANSYIERLKKLGASAAVIGQLQSMRARPADSDLLKQATSLSKTGRYSEAMEIYRKLYGSNPPAGQIALVYYDTQAALPAERARAIEGLRKLARQFPADDRYSITLGRVLTYDAPMRNEGISLLQRYPNDSGAQAALKQAATWNERAPIAPAVAAEVAPTTATRPPAVSASELGAGFRALNSGNLASAEQHFRAALAREATHGQANAGLGFVNMRQRNFDEAVRQFEQSRAEGDREAGVAQALETSQFWQAMGRGQTALDANDLDTAINSYRSAIAIKSDNPDALVALGGTLLRAGRAREAVPYLQRAVRVDAKSQLAWRALFLSQSQAAEQGAAIKTAEQIPTDMRAKFESDSEFLGVLAVDYATIGNQAQSDRVLRRALNLIQAENTGELSAPKLLQYASLMMAAKRYNSAVRSYRRVVTLTPDSADAWRGLVAAEHLAGRDDEALREFRQMPAAIATDAQSDTAFLSMLAGIYQSQSKSDAARATIERAIRIHPSLALQLQLASIEMSAGDQAHAVSLYQQITDEHPDSKEAWVGYIQGLHTIGRDREALRQITEVPEELRTTLQEDPDYLQALASVYGTSGDPRRAADAIERVNEYYAREGIDPPAAIQIQQGWLWLQTGSNARLASVIRSLSNNADLTADQQAQLSRLWASWTLQRASQLSAQGRPQAAVMVLSAALRAFPSDVSLNNALAEDYFENGEPKRAMALYARQNIAQADASICASAIRAALAANDRKQAQAWLETTLDRFGRDSQILQLAAEFEQQRGDSKRAAAYYRAALDAAGPPTIEELTSSQAQTATRASERSATQDLFQMLSGTAGSSERNPSTQSSLDSDALWPARPSTLRSEDSNGRDKSKLAYDDPLPPLETPSRPSRGAESFGKSPSVTKDAFNDEPALPRNPQAIKGSRTEASRTHQAFGSDETDFDSPVTNALDRDDQKATGFTSRNAEAFKRSPSTVPERRTSDASSLLPQVGDETLSIRSSRGGSQPYGGAAVRSSQKLDTLDSPESASLLSPLPAPGAAPLPPLTGPTVVVQRSLTPREDLQQHLDALEASSSPYVGGRSWVGFHSGQPGFDRLTIFTANVEQSAMVGSGARLSVIEHPTLLQGGTTGADATFQLGTLPSGAVSNPQNAAGIGGELQLRTRSFGAAIGYTPHGFLVANVTGRLLVQPDAGPVTFSFERQSIEDSQLSYAGLRDPGSVSSSYRGNIWGGVISNAASLQINHGDAASGWYASVGGQYITGQHIRSNNRIDGFAGAYWSVWQNPAYGKLTLGMNLFGMHFANNQRLFTYGNGGYFSPGAYLLSNIPITFEGQRGPRFHYRAAGSLGLQAFQEDAAPFYPLDASLQAANGNPFLAEQTSVGANYNFEGDGSYLITDHWHVGGFVTLDNARGYNNDRVGFYLRYALRPQSLDSAAGPTGIDRSSRGLRPLQLP